MYEFFNVMNLIIKVIYCILSLLSRNSTEKLLKSIPLKDVKVLGENGWTDATHIHLTKPFEIYKLTLKNGLTLDCADEHIVFTKDYKEKWVRDLTVNDYVITQYGLSKVVSVERTGRFVNMCDLTVDNIRHSYYTNNILSHNTTTTGVFLLHYICFNIDKNTLIVANKFATAKEIIDKIKKIYVELPYFIKPGIYKWNEAEIVMDNGCRVQAEATTINSGIGQTIHMCIWDEAAHVHSNIADKFYNNLFPTLTAAKAKMCISSTQNGYNLFYRLYKSAEANESEYGAFKTDWDEVPEWNPEKKCWEKRDEAWRLKQIANYGSEEAFNSQFGTNFDISANTLISQKKLNKEKQNLVEFVEKDLYGVTYSNSYYWHPNYEPMEMLKKDHIVITCDLAEGVGGDSTVFKFHRMINIDSDQLECIGYFKSKDIIREKCTYSLQTLICKYMNQEKILLSYEKNTYGELFYRDLMDNIEKDDYISKIFDPSILVKYYNDSGTKFTYGIKLTPGNKSQHCLLYKESYERDKIINNSSQYMIELSNFSDDGTGHYKASFGHDDMVMASVQLEFVKRTLQYKMLRDDFASGAAPVDDNIYNAFEGNLFDWEYYVEDINNNIQRLMR